MLCFTPLEYPMFTRKKNQSRCPRSPPLTTPLHTYLGCWCCVLLRTPAVWMRSFCRCGCRHLCVLRPAERKLIRAGRFCDSREKKTDMHFLHRQQWPFDASAGDKMMREMQEGYCCDVIVEKKMLKCNLRDVVTE